SVGARDRRGDEARRQLPTRAARVGRSDRNRLRIRGRARGPGRAAGGPVPTVSAAPQDGACGLAGAQDWPWVFRVRGRGGSAPLMAAGWGSSMAQREVVIVGAVRTAVGRYAGSLKGVRADDLAAFALAEVVRRTGVSPELIDDVVLGCTNQAGEDNRNVARVAVVPAGVPRTGRGQQGVPRGGT